LSKGRPDLLSACLESFASVHPSNAAAAPNLAPKKARARQGGRASTVEGPLPRSLDTGGTSLQGTHDDNNEYGNYDNDDNNDSAATAAAADAAAADDDDDDEMNTWMKSVCAVHIKQNNSAIYAFTYLCVVLCLFSWRFVHENDSRDNAYYFCICHF
jgi:hypothetical protein